MADNVEAAVGSGGPTFATDDDGTAHHPYVKVEWGADNTQTKVSTGTGALPVQGAAAENAAVTGNPVLAGGRYDLTPRTLGDGDVGAIALDPDGAVHVSDGGNSLTVNGTLSVNSHDVTNAGTFAVQIADTSFAVADGNALGEGVLVQGDDGTDRKNINVDATTGDVQVDITHTVTVDGSGVTQPVSGTVTANLGVTDNAVLDSIDTAVNGTLAVSNAGLTELAAAINTSRVDVTLPATPTANLATIAGDTTSLDAKDFATQTTLASALTSLQTIDDPVATISATPLQRVAIFDASDSQITSFGGGTEYTEDAVAAADPIGKATILVREDAPVTVAVDGDNVAQRGTAYGAGFVQVLDSSGNFIDTFGGAGGTSSADDADFVAGTTAGTQVQGVYESSPTTVTDGDIGQIGITSTRAVRVSQEGTVTVDGSGVTQPVSGTVTANLSATDNAVLDNIQTSVDTVAAAVSTEMQVDVVTSALPTGAATAANQLPATSGGISTVFRDEDIDEAAVAAKVSGGQVYWIHCINLDATPVYLHFYDVAQGSVTVGTTAELMSFAVPSQGDANGAGFTMNFPHGVEFSTAITVACTTTIGGTAGPAANEVILNVGYK